MLVNRILRAAFTKFNRIKYEVEEKGKTRYFKILNRFENLVNLFINSFNIACLLC